MDNISDIASRLRAIIETAVDGIITIDEFGQIESANPATCKIFGYTTAEMMGQNITMLMPTPHREQHDGYLDNYKRTGIRKIIGIGREVKGVKKDGTQFPFWLSVSEVLLENRRLFTGIVHDMTEQKKAEEALVAVNQNLETMVEARTNDLSEVVNKLLSSNQRLQHEIQERKAAEQALLLVQNDLRKVEAEVREALKKEQELGELKSRFVSMASHEFRTPLSTILSSTDLASQYQKTEQQDKRDRHFDKIRGAVNNLIGILNDFLSLSRLEEGRVAVQIKTFDFAEFCAELTEEMSTILKPHQKIVHNHPLSMSVNLDRKILKMVFSNLISNASKYSEDGKTVFCSSKIKGDQLIIDIRDEGMGIPEADKPYMFDRFFRASNVTNIKGTGLGLNIVKRYVELMNGTIGFESELGSGSVFTVVFEGVV
jgi:two-component system, LuxR family, sensor kinase FixL